MAARTGVVLAGLVVAAGAGALWFATRPRGDSMDLLGGTGAAAPAEGARGTATAEGGAKPTAPGFADAGKGAAGAAGPGLGDHDSAVAATGPGGTGGRPPAGEVRARVVSSRTEKPVAGVSVKLSRDGRPGDEKGLEASSGADGAVRLTGVPAGGWTLTASLQGFETLEKPGLALGTDAGLDIGDLALAPTPALRGLVRRPAARATADSAATVAGGFAPVAGAKVEVVNEIAFKFGPDLDFAALMRDFTAPETLFARATTDAEGRFALFWDEVKPGPVAIRAAPSDRAVTFANAALEAGRVVEVTLTADPAVRLAGQVVDHAGAGISGVPVSIAANPDDPTFFLSGGKFVFNRMFTTSDVEGKFEFPAVRAGGYMIFAGGTGRWPRTQAEGPAPSDTVRIVIPEPLTVVGTVTDAKTRNPVPGADVLATGGRSFGAVRADGDGKFRLEGLAASEGVRLSVKAPGYAPGTKPVPKGAKDEVTVNVELTAGLTITGRVVAAKDGAPVAGASVFVFAGMGDFEMGGAPKATTDADGRFSLPGISPEGNRGLGSVEVAMEAAGGGARRTRPSATLHVQARGFVQTKKTTVELVAGEDPKGIEIRLDPAARVTGRVVDPAGKGVEGAEVKATKSFSPRAGEGDVMDWFLMMGGDGGVKTGPDGAFALESVVPGPKVKVAASHEDFAKATSVPFEARAGAETKDLTLTLTRGGRIVAQVLGPTGQPLEGATLFARRVSAWEERLEAARKGGDAAAAREAAREGEEGEMDLAEMMGGGENRPQTSDGQGRAVFARLPPGRYKVGAGGGMFGMRSGGGGPAGTAPPPEVAVTVEEGRDATATLQFRLALAISGVVLDEAGAPVAGAWVSAQAVEGSGVTVTVSGNVTGRTDSAGRFKIEGVAEGEYRIHAFKQGMTTVTDEVKVRAGASNVVVKLKKPEGTVPVPAPGEDMGEDG